MGKRPQNQVINLAIVEDDAEVRRLTATLVELYPFIQCVGIFESAEAFQEKVSTLRPDVVLMDITLSETGQGKSGIDCVRELHPLYPDTEFLMFTIHTDSKEVFEALSVGAAGYILKGALPEDLVAAIQDVYAGGSPMSSQIARMVTRSFERMEPLYPELEKLTSQERRVLEALVKGYAYKKIADQHFVSESTIKSQVYSIYQKLEVHTRTDAINKAFRKKD
ncbi:MAG: response regulator transcription factor [Bacteroidia bacterium]|nr:response regulator transcription factor [Bacteroidia bacterium]